MVEGRCGQDEKGGKLSGMSSPHVDVYTGCGGVPGLGHGHPYREKSVNAGFQEERTASPRRTCCPGTCVKGGLSKLTGSECKGLERRKTGQPRRCK